MQSPARLLLVLLLVIGVGAGIYQFTQGGNPNIPRPDVIGPTTPEPDQPTNPEARTTEPAARVEVTEQPERRVVTDEPVAPTEDQGISGRVLLPNGSPATDIELYVIENASSDPLRVFLANQTGEKIEPVAQGFTAGDGSFQLGIALFDKKFDLRVVSPEHPEDTYIGFRLRRYEWHDTGDITLELGSIVHGRVIDEVTGAAIPDATVYLNEADRMRQMMPTPGMERGMPRVTDASGFFRYQNAPPGGRRISIGAEAEGYAYTELVNEEIAKDGPTEFLIKLAKGTPISGVVVDSEGAPIQLARVRAAAMSAKLPQNDETVTGEDGSFLFPSLRAGAFRLDVSASGYENKTESAIVAPSQDVKIVLVKQAIVKLRVLGADGRPVQLYKVGLKRYFPNNPGSVGKVAEFPDIRISPRDYVNEYAQIRNVPHGHYVFQVEERGHAKTLSPPFMVGDSDEDPVVEMTLTMGAAMTGLVLDSFGNPVAGATVSTDLNGGLALGGGDFAMMIRNFAPDTHTTAQTRTDQTGRFTLTRLAFAQYMVRIVHPDYCDGAQMNITLDTEAEVRDLGTFELLQGSRVSGSCTVDGRPTGQVRITISPPEGWRPETDANGNSAIPFSATAISETFSFLR